MTNGRWDSNAQAGDVAATIVRRTAACAAAALFAGGFAAAVVLIGGLGDEVRTAMRLPLAGWPRNVGAALDIAAHNTRLAVAALVCAYVAPRVAPTTRVVLDCGLAAVLAQSAALVGVALAAYGMQLAPLLALHVPLELLGLSAAGGAYVTARQARLSAVTLVLVGVACGLLLVAAGLLETFTPLASAR